MTGSTPEHEHEHERHVPEAAGHSPQGRVFTFTTPHEAQRALELAFDYRGDVTLTLADGRRIEGYLFDRRDDEQGHLTVRLMMAETAARESIAARDVREVAFTGRDTALGKSWETWVRQYAQRLAEKQASNSRESS